MGLNFKPEVYSCVRFCACTLKLVTVVQMRRNWHKCRFSTTPSTENLIFGLNIKGRSFTIVGVSVHVQYKLGKNCRKRRRGRFAKTSRP